MSHGERLHPASRLAALVERLEQERVPRGACLLGTGLEAAELASPSTAISYAQLLHAGAQALRLSRDPALGLRTGGAMHLWRHGTFGLLLLSCGSFDEFAAQAVRYQRLAMPAFSIAVAAGRDGPVWRFVPMLGEAAPPALAQWLAEWQVAETAAHCADLLGPGPAPILARFAHPAPAHAALCAEWLRCPCVFDAPVTELHYPEAIRRAAPAHANPHAMAALRAACDRRLAELDEAVGWAGRVEAALRRLDDPGAGMRAVARALGLNERTLRRRLEAESTSFTAIAQRVKFGRATQVLGDRAANLEQVAAAAGFSDPSNFRRAFIRWTHQSPVQFRQALQQRAR